AGRTGPTADLLIMDAHSGPSRHVADRTLPISDWSVPCHLPKNFVCVQPYRRPPQRRLHEYRLLEPAADGAALLLQQPGPAERAQHLDVELGHHIVIARDRPCLWLAEQLAAEVATVGAVVGLDVQHVQEDVPVPED